MSKKKEKDNTEFVTHAAGGAAAGAAVSSIVGGMGLAVGGTAVGIGMLPVAIAGAVLGTAFYGVKKAMED